MKKTERNNEIVKLSQKYIASELAEMFEISRERVRQILEANGVTIRARGRRRNTRDMIDKIIDEGLLGTQSDGSLSDYYDVSDNLIRNIRNSLGIPRYQVEVGCEKCYTNPYAKGYCKACYMLNLRRSKIIDG